MSTFTVLEIVDMALDQAQMPKNADFRVLGRRYLKLIIAKLVTDERWSFYKKNYTPQAFIAGQTTYNLPADYRKADTVYITQDSAGVKRGPEIIVYDQLDFDRLRPSTVNGVPNICYVDQRNKQIVFSSAPEAAGYYWKLSYFSTDINIDVAGTSTDNSVLVFENDEALVQELMKWLYEFRDDERYLAKKAEADESMREAKVNSKDNDANSTVTLASRTFRAGVRPIRGGGGGSWL